MFSRLFVGAASRVSTFAWLCGTAAAAAATLLLVCSCTPPSTSLPCIMHAAAAADSRQRPAPDLFDCQHPAPLCGALLSACRMTAYTCAAAATGCRRSPPPGLSPSPPPPPSPFSVMLQGVAQPSSQGRLMVYINGAWGPVANYPGTDVSALGTVACRQLGYASSLAAALNAYRAPQDSGQSIISCLGSEASISYCTFGASTGGYDEVEVACAVIGGEAECLSPL